MRILFIKEWEKVPNKLKHLLLFGFGFTLCGILQFIKKFC